MKDMSTHYQLSKKELKELKSLIPVSSYNAYDELIYEGHFPKVAYVFLSGKMSLHQKKKLVKELEPGTLIGAKELMDSRSLPYSVSIYPDSETIVLDKSTLLELMNSDHEVLKLLLSDSEAS